MIGDPATLVAGDSVVVQRKTFMASTNVLSGSNRQIFNDGSNNVVDPVLHPEYNALYSKAMAAVSAGTAKAAKQYLDIDKVSKENMKNTPLNLHKDEDSVYYTH